MGDSTTGQISAAAAKIYDDFYLPALFDEWCPRVISSTKLRPGQAVIDVACGTGVLAIAFADIVGPSGSVAGIDINVGMLERAKAKSSFINWCQSPAEALPFDNDKFDLAASQFGLMYFENQEKGLREMMRVLQPGGTLIVVVWDSLEHNPGLAAEELLWQQTFGEDWGDDTPYSLGDKASLCALFERSGIVEPKITTLGGMARFDSIRSWIHTGAKGWTEDDALSSDQLSHLLEAAEKELARFKADDGTVTFETSAHIASANKPL